jgi:hypothetical protein
MRIPLLPMFLAAAASPAALAQTLILPPTADATTDQSQPAVNSGAAVELGFGKNFVYTPTFTVWFMRAHVLFDLTPIQQTGRWPTRVLYRWYQNRASAAGCLDVTFHRLLQGFGESTVTWQNQPPHDANVVATACVGDTSGNGWKEADVTDLVHAWLAGTVPNFGFVIRDPSETTAGAARPGFSHSRETATAALAPYLQAEFAERFGFGCSQRALLPMADVTAGRPQLGGSFTLGTVAMIPGSLVGVAFGGSNTSWSGGALPWSLAPIGFPGCDLYVSPDVAVSFPPIAGAGFDLVLSPPSGAHLAGLAVYMQVFALPPVPGLGLEASNGVGVVLQP